jgi:hypothetical protein
VTEAVTRHHHESERVRPLAIELALKGKKIQLLALLYYWFVVVFEVKIVFCSESAAVCCMLLLPCALPRRICMLHERRPTRDQHQRKRDEECRCGG